CLPSGLLPPGQRERASSEAMERQVQRGRRPVGRRGRCCKRQSGRAEAENRAGRNGEARGTARQVVRSRRRRSQRASADDERGGQRDWRDAAADQETLRIGKDPELRAAFGETW